MDLFSYRDGRLFCEDVSLDDLAGRVGTPMYVYSRKTLETHYDRIAAAFGQLDPIICYSIKSCGNVHICKLLGARGAGMDVVSGGELFRAKAAGVPMGKVVYAGVGKTDAEIRAAIAKQMNAKANAALRVNPDVYDAKTHAKTTTGKKETKFGVDIERARRFFERYGKDKHLQLNAIHLHIGSPIYSAEPYVQAITKALELIDELKKNGHAITAIDIGGGFAADYESGASPDAAGYAKDIVPLLLPFKKAGGKIILEPGRTIAANAGVLITRVQYIKMGGKKKFVIVDTGMHHLVRPTLYDSFHFIWPTKVAPMHLPKGRSKVMDLQGLETCDVVGPICESGDFLAKDREMPPVARGDLLCVFTAGAYGMVMSSNYNAMPRPPEVLVDGKNATIIRRRETYDDLLQQERETATV